MNSSQWTFIGAGNMASSLVGGLIASGVNGGDITVVDINTAACQALETKFGVNSNDSVASIGSGASVVIAVKPHIVETVCRDLSALKPALVISVAAGVRSESMSGWVGTTTPVVRCMPNTPSLLGLGATALFANALCTTEHKDQAQQLLSTAGITQWVDTEAALDAVTALSGSGPAYFFYLIEHMANAAQSLGLDAEFAREFAIETAFGAASMARAKEYPPNVLRENVTSKGGTTAAALAVFDEQGLDAIVKEAMQAAHDRANELGEEFGTSS